MILQAHLPLYKTRDCIDTVVRISFIVTYSYFVFLAMNLAIPSSGIRNLQVWLDLNVCLVHRKCCMFMNYILRLICYFLCIIMNGNEFFRDLITTPSFLHLTVFFLLLLIPGPCYFKIYRGLMGNPGGVAECGGGEVLRRTGPCSC